MKTFFGKINPGAIVQVYAKLYVMQGVFGIIEGQSEEVVFLVKDLRMQQFAFLENLYTILQLSKCHLFIIKIMISL